MVWFAVLMFLSHMSDFEHDPGHMPEFTVDDLIGRSFLLPPEDNGEQHQAKIIKTATRQ